MSLKDLVVRGPMPKAKRKREPSLVPIHTDDEETWLYVEPKGLRVVHEIRDKGVYVRTDQVLVKWVHIKTALAQHST